MVGRLSFGQIVDKIGAYKSLLISLVVTIVALIIMSTSFSIPVFFVALALLGFSFGALLVIYPPLTGGAFGTSNLGVNYGIMFLGYAASTWISQPIAAILYHANAGNAAYQQSFYGAIVIAAVAVLLTVYMMVSDNKKKQVA
ncbi:MFS transporter [Atopobium minutum]|uniref:MFS transporter n=1 Tax=Atopobium minutum TaxID=1381 RepID=UPI0027E41B5D|nr:MFS transporter [Atopobium minutum]